MISFIKKEEESPLSTRNARVSLFIPSRDGLGGGGAEQIVLYLAEGFSEKGLKVDLVLLKTAGIFMSKVPPGVQVIDLGIDTEQSFLTLRKLFALMRYLKKEQPTALFAISDTDNVAMWAKRFTGISTKIITVLQVPFSAPLSWIKTQWKRSLVLNSYRWVDGIIACSQGVAKDFVSTTNLSSHNIKVICNPVDISKARTKAKEPVDHPWFTPDQPPVILGVGRLAKQKNFSTLIRAFALVRQQQQAKLIIVGEGEQRSELEALIEQLGLKADVDLVGFQMNPYAYMASANLFVLSSIFEGCPLVMLDALAVGVPIVSTDCNSGPADILDNGKYGNLVPIRDVEALANAITKTLDSPISSEILQERAKDFSLETIVDQYLEAAKLT